jgi:hypothetical protein
MHDIIDQLRKALPPIFLGSLSDELTGGAVHWATIQNKRSRREIPDECFLRCGTRNILVIRDRFLDWWGSTLRPVACPPQPRAGRRGQICESQRGDPAKE